MPTTPRTILGLVLLLVLPALPAAADDIKKIELSPFFGYRFGGDFVRSNEFDSFDTGFAIDDSTSAGLALGINLSRHLQIELRYAKQESELLDTFFDPDLALYDVDVEIYHAGLVYQWTPGQIRPYMVISIGATSFDAAPSDIDDDTRFSVGLGAGVKVMVTDYFGLRFEARGYATAVDNGEELFCNHFDDCFRADTSESLYQGEITGGLVFAF